MSVAAEKSNPNSYSYIRKRPPRTTIVYDTYWRFAAERQAIFYRRLENPLGPWTKDPILSRYKFTNAYRAADRVSQFLIRNVIYRGSQAGKEVFFRTVLFKLFNRVETWNLLERAFGNVSWEEFSIERYDHVFTKAMKDGIPVYSAAYIMPSGGFLGRKHRMHLELIDRMMRDALPERIADSGSQPKAFHLLHSFPTIGNFLAYQYATDLNYSELTRSDEMEFVVPGPGARSGIRKCFEDHSDFSESDLIRWVADRQETEFERLGIKFKSLWGRRLQLIDCQNLFCEVDKYARIAHPEYSGDSGRTRIKQKLRPSRTMFTPWFPPKWGLNDRMSSTPENVPGY